MKLLIVEDDALHRAYLHEAVLSALPECGQVIEAGDGQSGEQLAREHKVERIVMDLQMSPRNGIEAARAIWQERPGTSILFWSNYADEANVRGIARIVPKGAVYGYVLKSASEERLRLALRSIFIEAQIVIDREVWGLQQRGSSAAQGLSESEYEVLVDIALGLTDRMIARRRRLSLRSVQNRLQSIYEKLDVYQSAPDGAGGGEAAFNLRARAVTMAFLRKLLNHTALERAEADLSHWLQRLERQAHTVELPDPQ
ncbi:response regulator [Pannonibacter sp. Q-1]|uniref:Two-component system response regulator n=1 Tax=Pannonibacter phragmitetus TaxID=121719 RepID=A0A0L0J5E7_9HYPH|nr:MULTISPECIES: response regulator transcription factor [Pannonibacter]ALV29136.1 two-component system response regulator [Pannonibacter phragmitetus]KND20714.1 chemotaxis protein CheY [Pannonibacter phragmitetus]MBA4205356.1 two-component system response regulator NarL [Polymorphum sp.]